MRAELLFRYSLSIVCLLLLSLPLQGRHIIGGVMTYECLGSGSYEFTLRVYRDCNCTNCANFDTPAFIAAYNCNNCNFASQGNPFREVDAMPEVIQQVETPDYPCLEEPDICVQEAIYRFQLDLPVSDESYFVSYQRCCRNATVSNLVLPDDQGATYFVEITPEAQAVCNSSPVFDDFPPTVICANEPLEFDHSATDADGDQLVYSLCPSWDGGGNILTDPGYRLCDGAQPTPACPPPYDPISFNPPFSPTNPMGGVPPVTIDPNTGMITGTPTNQGQFVVGVCVEEYRDGELLSTTVRDFQFNVERCDPTVIAQVGQAEAVVDQQYTIVSCGDQNISFVNESIQERFIEVYEWNFMIDGQEQLFDDWEPTVAFPDTGTYMGQLILNPGTTCGDTALIEVIIYPEITADFEFAYDTCAAGPVTFTDLSTSGSGQLTAWSWEFADGNNAADQNPLHTYEEPGDFPVALTATDINGCEDTHIRDLAYFPVPNLIIIAPSAFVGCVPGQIFFDNLSTPINESYDITWDFGDGGSASEISPTYTYETPGIFTVSVDIISPVGCQVDTVFEDLIQILPSPVAGFSFSPLQPSNLEPEVDFFDESENAVRWNYDFGDGRTSTLPSPTHEYRDTGQYTVRQIVTHPSGCQDTLIRIVDVIPEVRYFLPNAFTPNQDGRNDEYRGSGVLQGASNFRLRVFNRWGEAIFETDDPMQGWNGRKNNSGPLVPQGTYMVLVTFTGPRGDQYEYRGTATVVR